MRSFKLSICLLIVLLISFYCISPCFAEESVYVWSPVNLSNTEENTIIENASAENITTKNTITENITNENTKTKETNSEIVDNNSLSLESSSAILIEQTTGQILYSHNIHEQLRPASVTKVMSILLIMEALDNGKISLTDNVPCSENAASMGGSQIWLDTRETLTVDEMLKAICVASANDCKVQFRH